MKPVMYLFMNRGLGMSKGKFGAQSGHAACKALRISEESMVDAWDVAHHETKLVMLAEDEMHLHTIQRYLEDREFKTALVVDEGRTEVRPFSATALGVEIVDKDDPHTAASFGDFRVYKDLPQEPNDYYHSLARFDRWLAGRPWHPKSGR